MTTDISGYCATSFKGVEGAFAEGFASGREVGAALAVWHDGKLAVDLWAGHKDRKRTLPWQQDTLVCCFSVSKAITATCLLQAVDQGLVDLHAPVAQYWPEYACAGKQDTKVRQLLCHQAGLPGLRSAVDKSLLFDWDGMCAALAAETPWWPVGSAHGYHARTFGFLVGEVLRRASGLSVGQWLAQHIAAPQQMDVHIGLGAVDHARCADMIPARVKPGEQNNWPPAMRRMLQDFTNRDTPTGAAFQNPSLGPGYMNSAEFRSAELPALNGHGTARDLARLMAQIPALLSSETFRAALSSHSRGEDQVLKSRTHFGLGYMLYEDESPIGWPGCFGHAGAGGSIAFCDPERGVGFAFVMNQMQEGVVTGGTSATACANALQACLG